jgi:hypothetical protein
MRSRWRITFLVVFAGGLAWACATEIAPGPYDSFRRSTLEFQTGSDGALAEVAKLAEVGFATPSAIDAPLRFEDVVLTWEEDGDPTQPSQDKVPLYEQAQELRRGTYSLNAGVVDYATVLSQLAGGSAKDAEQLDELARTANTNLRSARDALKFDISDQQVAIIAAIGAEAMRQKIEQDRRGYLRETLTAAQPVIAAFSAQMAATMNLSAGDLTNVYVAWADSRREEYTKAKSDEARRRVLVQIQERNDRTVALLETLRTLRGGYERMPAAHAELLSSLDQNEKFLASVRRLYEDGKRLQQLQRELAESKDEKEAEKGK